MIQDLRFKIQDLRYTMKYIREYIMKSNMTRKAKTFLSALLSALVFVIIPSVQTAAQELNKDVYVVRPYEPTLSDASKYSFLPSTEDVESKPPHFNYTIAPKQLENSFVPNPIKAAKTVTTSLPKIYNSWLKLAMGNYNTPLIAFNISNLRSKDFTYGAYLYHKSSHGKISLPNNHKVPAGYVVNNINLYGKRFYPKTTLSGNLRLDQNAFNYYGYNTELFSVPFPDIDRDSTRQRNYLGGVDLGIASGNASDVQLNYNISASLDYLVDKQKYNEFNSVIKAGLNKDIYGILWGLDLSLDYSKLNGAEDSIINTIFRFNPWISKKSNDWHFMLGFEAVADHIEITSFYVYPRVNLDIIIIENVLVPFIGLSGELRKNSYRNILKENHFIIPGTSLKNDSKNLVAYGGLKGSISSVVQFRADISYTIFKNYHFFVNDTSALVPMENKFTGVYDDIDLITYHAQLGVQPSGSFEFLIDGKYFDYKTFDQVKPWHKPDFEMGLNATYKFSSKFSTGLDVTITGNRWVPNYQHSEGMVKLNPVADINLNLNYHFSKVLTIFADAYNLADRSYMIWNQYPSQRFNFLIGFSYKL